MQEHTPQAQKLRGIFLSEDCAPQYHLFPETGMKKAPCIAAWRFGYSDNGKSPDSNRSFLNQGVLPLHYFLSLMKLYHIFTTLSTIPILWNFYSRELNAFPTRRTFKNSAPHTVFANGYPAVDFMPAGRAQRFSVFVNIFEQMRPFNRICHSLSSLHIQTTSIPQKKKQPSQKSLANHCPKHCRTTLSVHNESVHVPAFSLIPRGW